MYVCTIFWILLKIIELLHIMKYDCNILIIYFDTIIYLYNLINLHNFFKRQAVDDLNLKLRMLIVKCILNYLFIINTYKVLKTKTKI